MNYGRIVINVLWFCDGVCHEMANKGGCVFNLNIDDPSADVGVIFLSCNYVIGLYYDGVYYIADRFYSRHYVLGINIDESFIRFTKLWDGDWCTQRITQHSDDERLREMCMIVHETEGDAVEGVFPRFQAGNEDDS